MKTKTLTSLSALSLFTIHYSTLAAASGAGASPNILYILIDDLGYADTSPYGQKLADTPNFQRLADQGIKFTNAYAPAPISSPSRASMLTGKSPARLHLEFVIQAPKAKHPPGTLLQQPPYPRQLPLSETTIAEILQPAGYTTALFGKWHLSLHGVPENPRYLGYGPTHGPDKQGFAITSEERGSHPYNYPKKKNPPPSNIPDKQFPPDALTDQTIAFLQQQQNATKPFFLFLSHYYVHEPIHTRAPWLLQKYKTKAQKLGIPTDDPHVQFAAFIETMDHLLGRVLDELDRLQLTQNTLVILTSDNGGDPRFSTNNLRGSKWNLYEGGIRVPLIARWPGHTKPGTSTDTPVILTDLLPTLCDLTQQKLPDTTLDGISILPLITGTSTTLPRDTLTWHFPYYHPRVVDTKPQSALRKGSHKIIYFYETQTTELYDLSTDPLEQHNLAQKNPALAQSLTQELQKILASQSARLPTKK